MFNTNRLINLAIIHVADIMVEHLWHVLIAWVLACILLCQAKRSLYCVLITAAVLGNFFRVDNQLKGHSPHC